MIDCQRHRFDIPGDIAYLNCAYMSPLMTDVARAGERGVRMKSRPWEITTMDFFESSETARRLFARLIHAPANDIAITPSVSYGISLAARSLTVEPGREIVVLEDQFPSNVYPWRERARIAGARLTTVARPAHGDWTSAVLDAISETTAVAALPHCHWTDGALVDLVRIGERCRKTGTALVVDLTQSAGAMPFDVGQVRPDFLACAGYKWLLGPYSLSFTYVAPRWQQSEPLEYTWMGREGSEDFTSLVRYRDRYQPGAIRFDVGQRANFALMPMIVTALEKLLEWGVDAIASTLSARTADIAAGASELGLRAVDADRRAGHFLGLRFPDGPPNGLLDHLVAHRVYVSLRGDSMRVTPHLYNNDADTERLLSALRTAL